MIDTATNSGGGHPVPPGGVFPIGVAVTPDGKHVYVANEGSNNVSVIDTATNTVEAATIALSTAPFAWASCRRRRGCPSAPFSATQLQIGFGAAPNTDSFNLQSIFTLSSTTNKGIQSPYRSGHVPGGHIHHHHSARLLHGRWERVFHLHGRDRRREPAGDDYPVGHLAI